MHKQQGFSYIGLLLMISISGVALAGIGQVWHTQNKRNKELELLFIGQQFSNAIESYAKASNGATQYPVTLSQLLNDKRLPTTKKHLRKIYLDPMTNTINWGLVKEQGRIIGVYSQSQQTPLKRIFSEQFSTFNKAKTYSEWIFMATR